MQLDPVLGLFDAMVEDRQCYWYRSELL